MSERFLSGSTMNLYVVSAHQELFSGPVKMVSVTSEGGELGILPNHSPLLTRLKPGEARITLPSGDVDFFYVSGGMMEVQPNEVTILADTALRSEQIDETAATEAKRRAEETIRSSVLYSDRDRAQVELLKALAQLKTLADARKKRKG